MNRNKQYNRYSGKRHSPFFAKISLFAASFLFTLIVLVGIGAIYIFSSQPGGSTESSGDQSVAPVFTREDSLTMLLVGTDEPDAKTSKKVGVLVLVKVDPEQGAVHVMSVPPEIMVQNGSKTAAALFSNGGSKAIKDELSVTLDVSIDKYVQLSTAGAETILRSFGKINVNVPQEINYSSPELTITLPKGSQNLDGKQIVRMLRFPEWEGGRQQCVSECGKVLAALIDQYMITKTMAKAESLFTTAVNLSSTDISILDFTKALPAITHLAEVNDAGQKQGIANQIIMTGDYAGSGSVNRYTPDTSTLDAVKKVFTARRTDASSKP